MDAALTGLSGKQNTVQVLCRVGGQRRLDGGAGKLFRQVTERERGNLRRVSPARILFPAACLGVLLLLQRRHEPQ